MLRIRIKNWEKFQHYKKRNPPWIRLYKDLLDRPDWYRLEGRDAWVLASLWLLASEDATRKGNLPPIEDVAFRLRMTEAELLQHLRRLMPWLSGDASTLLALRSRDATPETEAEAEAEKSQQEGTGLVSRGTRVVALRGGAA